MLGNAANALRPYAAQMLLAQDDKMVHTLAPNRSDQAENAALRHQLIVLRRKVQGRVRLTNSGRVLPAWLADDSTITALIPYRQGLLQSVRVFIDHLAAEFPSCLDVGRVLINRGL